MARIKKEDLRKLAMMFEANIKEEFSSQHLSGNLVNSIEVIEGEDYFQIIIPARIYNFYRFSKSGVIVPRGTGSYASKLDTQGSEFVLYPEKGGRIFKKPHNHIGYVNKVVDKSLDDWLITISSKFEEKSRTDTGD